MNAEALIINVTNRLEQLRKDIQARMAEEGVNASGRTSSSLRVVRYDGGVKLVSAEGATAPIPTLEVGVIPLGDKAPSNFAGILYDWSKEKGLAFESEQDRWGFAFALKDKIRREGTLRHKSHIDVYTTLVNECVDELKANIKGYITTEPHQ